MDMPRRSARLALLLLALLALSPAALAHTPPSARLIQRVADDVVFSAEFTEPFAQSGLQLQGTGWYVHFENGEHPAAPLASLTARRSSGETIQAEFEMDGQGHFTFSMTFPERGDWWLEPVLASGERASLPVHVYPQHPARFRWAEDAQWNFVQLEPGRLAFTVDDDTPWTGATARIDHWRDDLSVIISSYEIALEADPTGTTLATTSRFNEPGLYDIHIGASEHGLLPGDRPPFQIYVVPREEQVLDTVLGAKAIPDELRATPGAPWVAALMIAFLCARRWPRLRAP